MLGRREGMPNQPAARGRRLPSPPLVVDVSISSTLPAHHVRPRSLDASATLTPVCRPPWWSARESEYILQTYLKLKATGEVKTYEDKWPRNEQKKTANRLTKAVLAGKGVDRPNNMNENDYETRVFARASDPECDFLPLKQGETPQEYADRFRLVGGVSSVCFPSAQVPDVSLLCRRSAVGSRITRRSARLRQP